MTTPARDQDRDEADIVTIARWVNDLTRPHDHIETYEHDVSPGVRATRHHRTRVPALLTQLGAGTTDTSTTQRDGAASYASKPPTGLDAIDTAATIDLQAARWIYDLTGEHPTPGPGGETVDLVRRVGVLAASADVPQQRAILRSVRGWRTMARVVTGWDQRPWAPDATCTVCGQRGTLRIRFLDKIGMCTHPDCRAWWDAGTIGLLADHVRAEVAQHEADRFDRAGGRRCQILGDYEPDDLEHLCRACGSARCVRAVGARLAALAATPVDLDDLEPDERAAELVRRERSRSLRAWKAWGGTGAAS